MFLAIRIQVVNFCVSMQGDERDNMMMMNED